MNEKIIQTPWLSKICLLEIPGGSWILFLPTKKKNRWHFLRGPNLGEISSTLTKPPILWVPFWSSRPCMACKHSSPANLKTGFSHTNSEKMSRWEAFFSHLSITMAYIYIYKYTYIYIHIYIYTYIHKVPSWKLTYPIKGPGKLLSRWFSELPILVGYVIDRSLEGNRYWILYTILLPERQIWNAEETYISENPNRKFTSFQNPFQHGKTIAASN